MLYSCSVSVDNFPWIGSCPVWSTTASDTVHRVRVEICHVNPLILVYACVPPSLNPSPFPLTDWSSLLEAQLILLFFIIILVCVCVCVKMPPATGGPVGYTPPEGGWGWAVVVGAFISIGFSYAFPKSITVFFKEIEVIFDATSSQVSWISSIMLAVMYAGGQFCFTTFTSVLLGT